MDRYLSFIHQSLGKLWKSQSEQKDRRRCLRIWYMFVTSLVIIQISDRDIHLYSSPRPRRGNHVQGMRGEGSMILFILVLGWTTIMVDKTVKIDPKFCPSNAHLKLLLFSIPLLFYTSKVLKKPRKNYVLLLCDVIRNLYSNSARTRTNEIASFIRIVV